MRMIATVMAGMLAAGAFVGAFGEVVPVDSLKPAEVSQLAALRLGALEPLPADPTNRVADNPRAVQLGQRFFFDTRFSANGKVACATCHMPTKEFQDGTPLAKGVGTTGRRTMPIASTAYSPWQFWDGRKDSQWAQALGPLESAVEHGGNRAQYAHVIAESYKEQYEALFGRLPDLRSVPRNAGPVDDPAARLAWSALDAHQRDAVTRVFVNMGKAIAAYERRIQYGPSRFDRFADSLAATGRVPVGILTSDEIAGARLFVGKANCIQCHNGPRFTDDHFHNTGVPESATAPRDMGRTTGAPSVKKDEFNCRSMWSDANASCAELDFMTDSGKELQRAFKTPSLRNVALRAPYMHAGQIADLDAVVDHYRRAPSAPMGKSELKSLRLSVGERRQLVAFLGSLSAPLATPQKLLDAPK